MLTTVGFVFYQNTVSLQEALNWEKHAQEVLLLLDETLTLSIDVETGVRGFIITGNETYLEPSNRAKQKIGQNLSHLRALTAPDTNQTDELESLEKLMHEAFDDALRKVDLRKSEGFERSVVEVETRKGRDLADNIRTTIERLKSGELSGLQIREQELDRNLYRTIWILIISSLAGIVSLGLANFVVFLEIKKRRSAESALITVNRGLEQTIGLRTKELQAANEHLKESAVERELLLVNEQKARQEAEIANRLRDEFMATVSHELRTPLNSILGWARLMKGGTLGGDQAAKAINTIIKNSETQNRLIEDLLDVARIISGKFEIEKLLLDPIEIITHSIESVRLAAEAKQISVNLETSESIGEYIEGDMNRLEQVFTNLLTNAIKFSPKGGTVKVRIQKISKHLEISVIDEGMGISPGFLPLVFERFRQDTAAMAKISTLLRTLPRT